MSEHPIIVETGTNPPDSCVIWLHGLGADGRDFESIVEQFNFPQDLSIRFIFPNAPMQAVTINQGFVMRSWYDITTRDICSEQDESGIRHSQQTVEQLIQQQMDAGIPSTRIILAGFSQGGVVVLQTALRSQHQLAGVMALSTYLSLDDSLAAEKTQQNQNIPIFLAHGSADPVIEIKWAYQTHATLIREQYKVEWNEYSGMPHSVSLQEIEDINLWLTQQLA
ncbi:MAG: dienelactone hydrolase family protein [Gammaproteobacteria bacterium]|nr:dienelactone hydrolase family protein [Gammaproteobacteria bacterium]